jgi:hypothetical protein
MPLTTDAIVLHAPGRFVHPLYESSDPDQRYLNAVEFNSMLMPSLIYSPAHHDLGELYSKILLSEEWSTVPLLPEQASEMRHIGQQLYKADGDPTPGYKNYLEKKKTYQEIDQIYQATPQDHRTPELIASHQRAEDEFYLLSPSYSAKENRYEQLSETASLAWRMTDIRAVSANTLSNSHGKEFLPSDPAFSLNDIDSANWLPVRISSAQLREAESSRFSSGAKIDPVVWWHWQTPSSVENATCMRMEDADFTIEFEAALAPINREWFDERVFTSRAWRWTGGSNAVLSDGNEDNNDGQAPLLIRSVVLVKSVVLSGPGIRSCMRSVRRAVAAKEQLGFGPFEIAGSNTGTTTYYLPPSITKSTIRIPSVQLIGFGSRLLERTPNPDPRFEWPNK